MDKCALCGEPAAHKVAQELDQHYLHPLTASLCHSCFVGVMGSRTEEILALQAQMEPFPWQTLKRVDVEDIVKAYLLSNGNGYDSLYNDDCGCGLDDFMPCGEMSPKCRAGYTNMCETCGDREDCPKALNDFTVLGKRCWVKKE